MHATLTPPRPSALRTPPARLLAACILALVAALIGTGLTASPAAHAADTDIVAIPDPELKAAINASIGGDRAEQQDVTELEAQSLTFINALNFEVRELDGLESFVNLETLYLRAGGQVSDLRPLAGLTKLQRLSFPENRVGDLSPLAGLTELLDLSAPQNRISDISPLAGATNLEYLNLRRNQISDITPVAGMVGLRQLRVENNQVKSLPDLSALPLLGASRGVLDLSHNQITDASPLSSLTSSEGDVYLDGNRVADLTPLAGRTRAANTGYQSAYVGPYQAGGVVVSLKRVDGTAPSLQTYERDVTYDAATGRLVFTGTPRDTVTFTGFRVYFSAPPADPSIVGTAEVGERLTVNPGTWMPVDATVTYQWMRNGSDIPGATSNRYTATPRDLGFRLSVRVMAGSVARTAPWTDLVTTGEPELPAITSTFETQSGVVGDPTNPGLSLAVSQLDAEGDLVDPAELAVAVTVEPDEGTPLTADDVTITGTGAERNVTFAPTAPGTATVTFTVTGTTGKTAETEVDYFVSKATSGTSRVLQGTSDPSTAIDAGDGYLLVADDEERQIGLYNPARSGPPVATFSPGLHSNEIDFESSARAGKYAYWLGSHGNSKDGEIEDNRHVVFATTISGQGSTATLAPRGTPYRNLRSDLIAWDRANGNRLGFADGTAEGMAPDALDGFNIEGAEFAPDGETLYLAFRSPVVPATEEGDALIVPLLNVQDITTGRADEAEFGEPILLDLGGQSIREIRNNANNEYLILGGTAATTEEQSLFAWSGYAEDAVVRLDSNLPVDGERFTDNRGAWEGIGVVPTHLTEGSEVRLIMDQGYAQLYDGSNRENKDDNDDQRRKARTDLVTLAGRVGQSAEIGELDPFGPQATGTVSAPQSLKVTNTGSQRLQIGRVHIRDNDDMSSDEFVFTQNTCEHANLGPDASCEIRIRFAPYRENAAAYATLVVESNRADGAFEVTLTGTSTGLPEGPPGEPGEDGQDGQDGQDSPLASVGLRPGVKVVRVERGEKARVRVVVSNRRGGPVLTAAIKAKAPKALRVKRVKTKRVNGLAPGSKRVVTFAYKIGKKAPAGRHRVKLKLKLGPWTAKRKVIVRVLPR